MKKILLFTIMALLTVASAVAQTTTLSYQAVVRDANNKFVQDSDIPVDVSITTEGTERYFESRTAHTNHNGVISFSIGGAGRTWPVAGHPTNDLSAVTGWANATITVTYHLSSGDVTVNSPVSAVPYALEVAPTAIPTQVQADWNESDNTTAAFIWNKPSFATVATSGDYNDLTNTPDLTVYATNAHLNDTLSHYPMINDLKDTATNVRSALIDTAAAIRADFPIVNNGTLTITYGSEIPVTFTANQEGNSEITIPAPAAPNNGAITITRNSADVTNGTFTVDQNTNQTIDIAVPTTVAELSDAADYAKVAADNSFTGTNTVPSGFDIDATNATNCGNVVVNACDLFAVFDSLNRRISALEDALDALMHAVPPTVTVSLSDITSNSMKATADANDNGTAITAYEFCISVNSDMSAASCFTGTVANYTFTGLDAYTTYYVTAKATNLAGSGTSSVVNARTPAHAPAGVLGSSLPPKPTGFQVTVSSLDFKEPAEGTVQIFYKQGSGCSADDDGFTAWPISGTLATGDDYTQNLTGLEPLTNYCVMVKVNNVDSTTTYGPVNTTSGEDLSLIITPAATNLSLCEGATVDDNFSAAPSLGDVEEYSYEWSDGTNTYTTNPVTMSFSTAGNKTITCTATHNVEGYILTATVDINVTSAGTAPTLSACDNMLVVEVTSFSSDVVSINWGDGSPVVNNPQLWPKTWHAYAAPGGTYDIVATNASGCAATQTVSLGKAILNPCTGLTAHEGGVYAGLGHDGADDGREYADENGIYAVTDYDGNVYPVVKIGSQCWMAENLRTEHSPATDALILLGKDQPFGITAPPTRTSYTSKMALWASGSPNSNSVQITYLSNSSLINGTYSEIVPRLGLLYNWCAAVDTFKTGDPEVSNSQNTAGWSPVLNLENGNRRGICPLGWHLPSEAEWETMLTEAGVVKRTGTTTATAGSGAGKLSTGCYWESNAGATAPGNYSYAERNVKGFSAIPAGTFNDSQNRYYVGQYALFWTSTQASNTESIRYRINYSWNGVGQDTNKKCHGASVHCVRDAE